MRQKTLEWWHFSVPPSFHTPFQSQSGLLVSGWDAWSCSLHHLPVLIRVATKCLARDSVPSWHAVGSPSCRCFSTTSCVSPSFRWDGIPIAATTCYSLPVSHRSSATHSAWWIFRFKVSKPAATSTPWCSSQQSLILQRTQSAHHLLLSEAFP